MFLYDFKCPVCSNLFEELVSPRATTTPCVTNNCKGTAERQLSAPNIDWRCFVFSKHSSEAAVDKWGNARKKKIEKEQRKLRDHGTYE